MSSVSDTRCQVWCWLCRREQCPCPRPPPPIQYSCHPTAADLVLMVVRRCRCRAAPGDPGAIWVSRRVHLGTWSSSSIWVGLLHLGEGTPPPAVSALHYQPTKGPTYSTVERLWFLGMTTMEMRYSSIWSTKMKMPYLYIPFDNMTTTRWRFYQYPQMLHWFWS